MFSSFSKQDDILNNSEEIPVTMPIYEGYLYWYSEKHKWKWHLFRFDGYSLICLSTRKVKLPRDTPIEPLEQDPVLGTSSGIPSPTSPLLATPIQSYTEENVVMASHYQLPTWSINLLQVTSISLLAPLNDKQQQQHRYSFCFRTTDKQCYLLKARKRKDLDRWLFILSKSWKWLQVQQLHQQEQQRQQEQQQDKKKKIAGPPTPPPHQYQYQASSPPPPSPQLSSSKQQGKQAEYEVNYTHPTLSAEKEKWIDEWRESLRSMAMPSPLCHKTSHRHSTPILLQERTSNKDEEDVTKRPISMTVQLTDKQSLMKKKRSDEVKNWMLNGNHTQEDHQDYDIHYFQDATTVEHGNDTSSHNIGNGPSTPSLHYHQSIRGKNIQIVQPYRSPSPVTAASATRGAGSPSVFDNHSPLYALSKVESTHDVYKQIDLLQSGRHQQRHQYDRPVSTPTLDITNYEPQRQTLAGIKNSHSSSSIVAPSLPPIPIQSSFSLYGSPLIFYPSRSTPSKTAAKDTVLHSSIAKPAISLLSPSSPSVQ